MVTSENFQTHRLLFKYDPDVGQRYVSNTFMREVLHGHAFFVQTNRAGFRSKIEFETEKTTPTRIVFLGDSHTEGFGVETEERFSDLIADRTDGVESYNFGIRGSGIDQHVLMYEKIASDYDHDIVCFSSHLEDIQRLGSHRSYIDPINLDVFLVAKPYFTLEGGELALHHHPVPRERTKSKPPSQNFLMRMGIVRQIYQMLPFAIREQAVKRRTRTKFAGFTDPSHERYRLTRALVARVLERAHPKPVILCPLPDPRIHIGFSYQGLFEELCREHDNAHFIDLSKVFEQLPAEERWALYGERTGHFSDSGHRLIADSIQECLQKSGLVSSRSA